MTKELINIEEITPSVLYSSDEEVESLITRIDKTASSLVCPIDTPKGRKEIASIAYQVARTKTGIVEMGKDMVSSIKNAAKEKTQEIDSRVSTIENGLSALKEKIRQPLTDFENAEKNRIAAHEANIDRLQEIVRDIPSSTDMDAINLCLDHVEEVSSGDFEEYTDGRDRLVNKIKMTLAARKAELELAASQAAEITRLQKEAKEREQKERQERAEEAEKHHKEDLVYYDTSYTIAEAKRKEDDETAARAADQAHNNVIRKRAVECMVEHGLPVTHARKAVALIAAGLVDQIKISY